MACFFCVHTLGHNSNLFNIIATPNGKSVNSKDLGRAVSSLESCMLHGHIPSCVREDRYREPEIKQNIFTVPETKRTT